MFICWNHAARTATFTMSRYAPSPAAARTPRTGRRPAKAHSRVCAASRSPARTNCSLADGAAWAHGPTVEDIERRAAEQHEPHQRDRILHIAKLGLDAGIKLSSVATDILGRSGRAMLHALIGGERDAHALAELAKARMRPKIPQVVEALTGNFGEHHAFLCQLHLERIDQLSAAIEELSARIEEEMRPFVRQVKTCPAGPSGTPSTRSGWTFPASLSAYHDRRGWWTEMADGHRWGLWPRTSPTAARRPTSPIRCLISPS
jgi:hypothetical protein